MTVKTEKGRLNKIHISIDGEYRFTVDADFWFSLGIADGCEIDEKTLEEMGAGIANRRAFNKGLELLSRRDHSRKELLDKLTHSCGRDAAESAVSKIEQLSLIDDERFAMSFAAELARRKGCGKAAIKQELLRRGIDRETAYNAAEETILDEYDKIKELLETKFKNRLNDEKGIRQTFNALVRLGYSFGDIRRAMREISDTDLEEN